MDFGNVEELSARLMVMELMLQGLAHALARENPQTAKRWLQALKDQLARTDVNTSSGPRICSFLTQSIHDLEQILAQKPQ